MSDLATYLDEGVALALELGNELSRRRRGIPVEPAPDGDTRRVAICTALRGAISGSADQAARAVNDLLRAHAASPALEPDADGRWRLHLHSRNADALSRQAVKAATGLATLIDDQDWSAIKSCEADRCDDYFLDRSRNLSGRYCSRSCANRVNARLHRARRAGSD